MYADYAFYTGTFYGTAIAESDFPRLSSRASDFIDYYTRGKAAAATDEAITLALSKACCAIAEQMQIDENNAKIAAKAQAAALTSSNFRQQMIYFRSGIKSSISIPTLLYFAI